MQTSEAKAAGNGGYKNFLSFFVTFALLNIKTIFGLGFGVFKVGWLIPMVGTMLVSLGLYASVYGWSLACIVMPLLLVHEFGHWLWMRAYKLNPQAPMFIPFLGAFVAMKKMPADEATHAWVAFAGPFIGGLGALACYGIGKYFEQPSFLAAAYVGFFLNLTQLIPAKPLDGGFIVGAISKWLLVPGILGLFFLAAMWNSVFLDIIAIVAVFSFFRKSDALGVTAGTVKELEQVFIDSVGAPTIDADGKPIAQKTGKASLKQRCFIGAAYLTLVVSLGSMITWITLETGRASKTFAASEIKGFDRIIAIKDSADLRFLRAQAYVIVGKYDEAEADFKKAIDLGRHDYDVYFNLARCNMLNGKKGAEPLDNLHKAIAAAKPTDNDWDASVGLLLCSDYDGLIKACQKSEDHKIGLQAVVMDNRGQIDVARKLYDEAVEKYPERWGPKWRRAMFNISRNSVDQALPDIDKALALAPDYPASLLTQGWYFFKKGKYDDAWKSTDRVIETAKDEIEIDKLFLLTGCHQLRYEIAEKKAELESSTVGECKNWSDIAAEELAAANKHPGFGTIFVPRHRP